MRWIAGFILLWAQSASAQIFDVVINHGRVMDPESGLDAPRHLGLRNGVIERISDQPLVGKTTIDARGLVVAPGFINLHWHGTQPRSNYYEAMDGVTATFELEIGVADVDRWYEEREGRMPVHYGVAIGHTPVRMAVMRDTGEFLPAGDAARRGASAGELARIQQQVEQGLRRGAVGVGFGLAYTPLASHWKSCRPSGWRRDTAPPRSSIFEAPRARAARIVSKACWR